VASPAAQRSLLLVIGLTAACLGGCEYADDVGPAPSTAASRTGNGVTPMPIPLASVDPELMAEMDRNMATLERAMVEVPIGLAGAAGGISARSDSGGGLEFSTSVTGTATYRVTAACIGAPGAKLSVSSASSNTLLEFTTPCAELFSRDVELRPGTVTVRLVAVGDGYLQAASGVMRINEAAAFPSAQP
jgi:hypothetical protein